jgi:hypothetical protein
MGWFTRICRNTGLMIHHAAKPIKGRKQVVSHETQQEQVNDTVTLRRTTIEEIEVKPDGSSDNKV